jgi:hypothetical protein
MAVAATIEPTKAERVYEIIDAQREAAYGIIWGVSAWSKIFSREIVEKHPYPIGKVHEDLATTAFMIGDCDRVVYGSRKVYFYQKRDCSITTEPLQNKHIEDGIKASLTQYEYIKDKFPLALNGARYRCADMAITFFIPRLCAANKSERYKFYKQIQEFVKPIYKDVCKDKRASIWFKSRLWIVANSYCMTIISQRCIEMLSYLKRSVKKLLRKK